MRFVDGALHLIELSWSVFPLSPGSKMPAIPKAKGGQGVLDASKDRNQILEWARRFPHANVGIACGAASGLTVIDFDPKGGSVETVRALKAAGQVFKPTVSSRTPSGGWHLYYGFVPHAQNSKSLLGKGIDVRTTGGYVVAPPSRLDGGGLYRWHLEPLGADIARMPVWAAMALKPREDALFLRKDAMRDVNAALAGLMAFIGRSAEGQRNSSLYWAACRAAEGGYADEGTRHMLAEAAGKVGITPKEAMKTIGSAFKSRRRFA